MALKILGAFILSMGLLVSCGEHEGKREKTDKYEETKETLAQTEQKNPARFITAVANDKKNLLGQTVVKGTITNDAKVVTFKDVELKLSFYSKTGTLLEQDIETIYETIAPGESKTFKSKFFTPKETDSLDVKVMGAKF